MVSISKNNERPLLPSISLRSIIDGNFESNKDFLTIFGFPTARRKIRMLGFDNVKFYAKNWPKMKSNIKSGTFFSRFFIEDYKGLSKAVLPKKKSRG